MLKRATISLEYPEHFRKAIGFVREKEGYNYSITELMKPLQAIYLAHNNDYDIDALKNTAALLGTAFHFFMEHQEVENPEDYVMEKRYFKTIEDIVVSGQMDLYHKITRTLWDYKTSGMYKIGKIVKSGDLRKDAREWVIQTNCYRFLSGLRCDHIKVLAIVKDFKYGNNYGLDRPAIVIDLPKIKLDVVEKWLTKRVIKVKGVLKTGEYPECTPEETWGGIRCRDWCDVNVMCKQFKNSDKCWLVQH